MPRSRPASASRRVIVSSAGLRPRSPDGWLCAMMTAAALHRIAALNSSLGCTDGVNRHDAMPHIEEKCHQVLPVAVPDDRASDLRRILRRLDRANV
jgi:hypothetical protein